MHYNQFTVDYIEAIKYNLKIEVNNNGEASFVPDIITDEDIVNTKNDIQSIWTRAKTAIDLVQAKEDATIQSGLFGLINELDTALKIGFLLSDRIVLIDYLFDRILLKKSPDKIDRIQLGVIASSLVSALPLAQIGRIVIIPNPFNWFPETKQIIQEVAAKSIISPEMMSLLNMLSITKPCQLHPYTIAESESVYASIINYQLNFADAIGKDGGEYAYAGILGALLSERLLKETELNVALGRPLLEYYEIISSTREFYTQYLNYITSGGSLNAQNNIDNLRTMLLNSVKERNNKFVLDGTKVTAFIGSVSSGAISLLDAATVASAPLLITGSILGLSATLASVVNSKKDEQTMISVFRRLYSSN